MSETLRETMTAEAAFDGSPATLVTLRNVSGMSVTFMDIGATWLSCILPLKEENREVMLGVSTMSDFRGLSSYIGTTVGRYANRIGSGQFSISGQSYQLSTNQSGNTLHGGMSGFDKRRWDIEEQGEDFVRFGLLSADGDQGFPGQVKASVTYQLTADNRVVIRYHATTDKPTPVNLTNHAYFNLIAPESGICCKGHTLRIDADQYLPITEAGIPLGELESVSGTGFDFRQAKTIGQDLLKDVQQQKVKGYDHAYLLNPECRQGACAAEVCSPDNAITLKVFTDKPALQLYTGNWLAGEPNRSGGEYIDYAGFALETQFLPDSPNHPEWDQVSCILQPDDEYSFETTYLFEF
ncbi:galactose-1-epimerase [Vibrio sp. HA2012]|uniref:galactose-1-epimerase n=1 Tax=Vibrio sp. HA2012 TaxID=1971595 RepID=UPI000C2B883A|nr:galactose-1-epimerase [Vibrio sp. HA2012]PJC86085.1 galactose-1-epimerase [Vibrio sp. HA2012]